LRRREGLEKKKEKVERMKSFERGGFWFSP